MVVCFYIFSPFLCSLILPSAFFITIIFRHFKFIDVLFEYIAVIKSIRILAGLAGYNNNNRVILVL